MHHYNICITILYASLYYINYILRVLCVWGVPGRAHEDDPARAVNTALAIHASLQAAGFDGATTLEIVGREAVMTSARRLKAWWG